MKSRSKRSKGFTLLEVLVVLAVVAILAAIAWPVFSRARENGRRTSCRSNLKQIGLAVLQYAQDADETLPRMYNGTSSDPLSPKWMDMIFPYAKSEQIFVCPSDSTNRTFVELSRGRSDFSYGSYGVNQAYGTRGDNTTPPIGQPLAAVTTPTNTIWAVDVNDTAGNADFYWPDAAVPVLNSSVQPRVLPNAHQWNQGIVERHLNTTSILFVDGHVKAPGLDAVTNTNAATPPVMPLFTIEED